MSNHTIEDLLNHAAKLKQLLLEREVEKNFVKEIEAKVASLDDEANQIKQKMLEISGELGIKKISNGSVDVTIKYAQPKVLVSDMSKIPEEYLRYKEPEVDKVKLKADLQHGVYIEGVELVSDLYVSVK